MEKNDNFVRPSTLLTIKNILIFFFILNDVLVQISLNQQMFC